MKYALIAPLRFGALSNPGWHFITAGIKHWLRERDPSAVFMMVEMLHDDPKDVHAHDVVTLADQAGVALRGGHHCTQPLMHKLGVESTARASFYFYNTKAEVDRFVEVVKEIQKFFGQ